MRFGSIDFSVLTSDDLLGDYSILVLQLLIGFCCCGFAEEMCVVWR